MWTARLWTKISFIRYENQADTKLQVHPSICLACSKASGVSALKRDNVFWG